MSLVEVMVVVAIIGIVGTLAIPGFKHLLPRVRLNNQAMVLSNEVALARVRAISQSTDYKIVFSPATERYTIWKFAGSWVSLGETLLSGIDLTSASGFTTPDTLIVTGNGQANVPLGTQAAIELRSPDGTMRKQLLVEPTGRMVVRKWNGTAFQE